MDILTSPLVTVILNLIAQVLVSKGILDSRSTIAFVQIGNSLIAGMTTMIVAVVSIHKMFNYHQVKLTTPSTISNPQFSQQFSQGVAVGQSGLPVTKTVVQSTPDSPSQQ